jgi:hypothetical protein
MNHCQTVVIHCFFDFPVDYPCRDFSLIDVFEENSLQTKEAILLQAGQVKGSKFLQCA